MHCALMEMQEDCLFITDLHSVNGLYVNGRLLEGGKQLRLKDGDTVNFGPIKTTVRLLSPSIRSAFSPSSEQNS